MPKSLSLKKGLQQGITKGQKSITCFFKSQDSVKVNEAVKSNSQVASPGLKRKASSPTENGFQVKQLSETSSNINKSIDNQQHKVKKKKKLSINSPQTEQNLTNSQLNKTSVTPDKADGMEIKHRLDMCSVVSNEIESNKLCVKSNLKSFEPISNHEENVEKITKNILSSEMCVNYETVNVAKKLKMKSPNKENGTVNINAFKNLQSQSICKNINKRSPLKSNLEINTNTNHDIKITNNDDEIINVKSPFKTPEKHVRKLSLTPKKSPVITPEPRCSPRVEELKKHVSPSRNGSTVKVALDFDDHNDIFNDGWNLGEVVEDCTEDLDLTNIQRCEVINVKPGCNNLELILKNSIGEEGTCLVEGIWCELPLSPGEIVSVKAVRDHSGRFLVNNDNGFVVFRPDHLVSTTSVVSSVFCRRKAVLQDRFKGVDSANSAMIIGIIIHELVQKALVHRIMTLESLREETQLILKGSTQMLYDAGLSVDEAITTIEIYLKPLSDFMQTYMGDKKVEFRKDQWRGHIERVLDIEENVCCPQLGLKGKIDATLQVSIHGTKGYKSSTVPLELKSGKASGSVEHRGQLLLYVMMLSELHDNYDQHVKPLLLYLKDKVQLMEVSGGHPEKRDLIMLRNQMAQYVSQRPDNNHIDNLTDIEEASRLLVQRLPEPINHDSACSRCPYLTLCSLHLWHTDGPTVADTHPLTKLRGEALDHLSIKHIKYMLHWSALIRMEEHTQLMTSPLHSIWTEDAQQREDRGVCAANLLLKNVSEANEKYLHVFKKSNTSSSEVSVNEGGRTSGPQEGEFCIVSVKRRPWIAAGIVTSSTRQQLHMMLERDLSRRLSPDTVYQVDLYASYATSSQNLTNLGALLDNNEQAERLRRLIIDKGTPEFIEKLPREVGRLGAKLMKRLNIEQQRAVLRALAAKQYALLQGLPGTGKTQTISVLIQMLVAMKQRVLVTAHTHSAVDTVLTRLPSSLRVMRLGANTRIATTIADKSEEHLTAKCETPEQLAQVYDSMEVVGVTCLGAAHALLARTTFDVCIVDEATQVLQCTVLRPLLSASRFVLVGDPEQLPPVVRNRAARRLGMEESLFHRLKECGATSTLQLQYRLNQPLVELANLVAYGSQLKCADDKVRCATLEFDVEKITEKTLSIPWLLRACSTAPENAALFVNMSARDHSSSKTCANANEACVVIAIVKALLQGGVNANDIGVIAPYREQVTLLRNALKGACDANCPEVSTVDQFQGRDKSVMLYSCTRSDDRKDKDVKEGEVLNDRRRMAVSVTRAKHKLLVIGHAQALKRYAPIQLLIDNCPHITLGQQDLSYIINIYQSFVR